MDKSPNQIEVDALLAARQPLAGYSFHSISFAGRDLRGVDFSAAKLVHCDLTGADLGAALFTGSVIYGCVSRAAQCRETDFTKATIITMDADAFDITTANCQDAILKGFDLSGKRIAGWKASKRRVDR